MRRLSSDGFRVAAAVLLTAALIGCGKHATNGIPPFPARITLSPAVTTSLQLGSTVTFFALAQNAANNPISTTFTYASTDTAILNVAPNGQACAGHWDATYTNCTPGGTGVVQVTASALGATSTPTFVFVHPPIDSISVTGLLLDNVPIQEPCLSQGQTMTLEAHAFSQGSDITASVGPFTWSANYPGVVKLTPIVNIAYNFATNRATATASTPGLTQIFASGSGVSSTSFQQPQFPNSQGTISPVFDFFETCPIQNIALELGRAGSRLTSFVTAKGTAQTAVATVTDVMGNSSLPNTDGAPVLASIPLMWTSSAPAVVATGTGCTLSCSLATPSAGAAAITASCSPPSCNAGFPLAPAVLFSSACTQFLQAQFPNINSCQQFIPVPVYSSPLPPLPGLPPPPPPPAIPALAGLVTGAPSASNAIATSLGCAHLSPINCNTSLYSISTAGGSPGGEIAIPVSPNSLLFDLAGDKAYLGSDFGVQAVTPGNLGTNNNPFTSESTITGKVLAVSPNGAVAIFSDTLHLPNQVYLLNTSNPTSSQATALNISGATTAGFSQDGLKAFIFGFDGNGNPNLYVDSPLQGLQTIHLPALTTVSSIVFSTNGAFAYVVSPSLGGGNPAVSVLNTCNNQFAPGAGFPLAAPPVSFKVLPDGLHLVALESNGNIEYITASITGIPPATLTDPANSLCPMTVSHTVQPINLGQGSIHPINLFSSADGSLLYVVASDRNSILVYDFNSGPGGGIQLANNATPVAADITADSSFILVAGSDSLLHRVSTGAGGIDQTSIQFPNLPNVLNPFCTNAPCTLDFVLARP